MEYTVQDIKVSENLMLAEANPTNILRCFAKPNMISLRDYELILCMIKFLH